MRYFDLRNFQDIVLYLFPALVFVVLFVLGLSFAHFVRRDSRRRWEEITERHAGGIEGRNAPFPVLAYLIIIGTIAWVLAYILLIGGLKVKI